MKTLANSWAFSRRIGPLIGMLLPPRLHLTFRMFLFSLCSFSDEFWKASNIFSLFFFEVARVLPGILNWFATPLLGLTFSSSFNSFYFTFKVTSWCFLFVAIFIASATNNRIQTNLKISKHSNIMAFELKHLKLSTVEYRRMKKLDSEIKIRITWWKIRPGGPKICSI